MSRINYNISSLPAIHRLVANQNDPGVRLGRLSSGLWINRGKDDPAGLIASENPRVEIQHINAAIENATRANNVLATAQGALDELGALLIEIRRLAASFADAGGLSSEERRTNQRRIDSILADIDRIADAFGAAVGNSTFGVAEDGANLASSPTVSQPEPASPGIDRISTETLGSRTVGYLSSLGTGNANSPMTGDGVSAQRIVDRAMAQIGELRDRLGAFRKNTLEAGINSLQVALENVTASESAIRDTDFAVESARMTRAQILTHATTTILRMPSTAPQNALTLLQ